MVSLQSLSTVGYETIKKEGARVLIEKGSQDEGVGNKLKKILTNDGFIV